MRPGEPATAAIVSQIIAAVEDARAQSGLSTAALSRRSGVSRRTLVYIQKLQVAPSLRMLLLLLNAVGLELEIRVRPKRNRLHISNEPAH